MLLSLLRRCAQACSNRAPHSRPASPRPQFRPRLEGLEAREVPAAVVPLAVQQASLAAQVASAQPNAVASNAANPGAVYEESLKYLWQIVKLTRNACQAPYLAYEFGHNEDGFALANEHKIRRLASAGQIFDDCMQARKKIVEAVKFYELARSASGDTQKQLIQIANDFMAQASALAYPAEKRWYDLWNKYWGEGWKALARYDIDWVREHFPNAWPNLKNYVVLGPGTGIFTFKPDNNKLLYTPGQYNCFAWSVGLTNNYFFPDNYADMHRFFAARRFTAYASLTPRLLNPRLYQTVAVYGYPDPATGRMIYTHAARQEVTGKWTSKLGELGLIQHDTAQDIAGGNWGQVVRYYYRRR
ncbi:MAG: hypothetical protein U0736_02945 [Gemmataceae bacterium]